MDTYITCIKGISKKTGKPYYQTRIATPIGEQSIFGADLVLAVAGCTAQELAEHEAGTIATFVLQKI